MVFTKDNLAVMVTCFTEKGWTGTLNPLDYCTWDILQELVYEGRHEPFADLCCIMPCESSGRFLCATRYNPAQ